MAASSRNPTGWALLKNKTAKNRLLYTDNNILENTLQNHSALIAIDAPLGLPKNGEFFIKTDKEMIRKGYRALPPDFPAMKKLTLRAINLNRLIEEKTYKAIEVHPTSTRKALQMPPKDWKAIQEILKNLGLKGEIETRPLATHEIDATTAALTAVLHLQGQTELIGDNKEGYIILTKKRDWKTLNMIEKEKLQRAVEATIAAGYQLNSEAFNFLSAITATDDPTIIMSKALQRLEELEEKPLFIDKSFLETLLKPPETTEKEQNQPQTENLEPQEYQITEGKSVFHPYAKDVEAKINVIEDPTGKLTSNGTLGEYLQYFQDRFKRIERLLRQRIDVRAATPISEAVKSPAKTKLKIICMIAEKRESKRNMILTVEDLQATATVLVTHNAREEIHKKAQRLLPDQVVCIAVVKTRSDLFLAEDIILPEIGQKPQRRATEPVYAVLTSDIHMGSTKFNEEAFNRFISWLNGKYGNNKMREIAGHVKYMLVAGDIVDGVGVYPNQINELVIKDVHEQYRFASKLIEQIPDYIEVLISPGNHDAPRKALPQPAIAEDFVKPLQESGRVHSLGNPCLVSLHNVEVLMCHGRSLDDIIATVPGLDHSHPEKAMKVLLQSRHLAPLYGGKTMLSPENRDFLVIERVPDIFHAGHIHVVGCCNHRGVLIVNSGGWQDQTDYMQKLGLVPTPGKVPLVNLQTLETNVLSFI